MSDKPLQAFEVKDNYEGNATVVFCTNGAAARREGASELGVEWTEVEHCLRKPEFDQYAPGPVSPLVLIAHGWWFECSHCGRRVTSDMSDEINEGEDPENLVPRLDGRSGVFCSDSCGCLDHMDQRGREEAADALREVFEAKFPGAKIADVHVYRGPLLECRPGRFVVAFSFPGGTYAAHWEFGEDVCHVSMIDVEPFKEWRKEKNRGG
jgi:hypothetical protein